MKLVYKNKKMQLRIDIEFIVRLATVDDTDMDTSIFWWFKLIQNVQARILTK